MRHILALCLLLCSLGIQAEIRTESAMRAIAANTLNNIRGGKLEAKSITSAPTEAAALTVLNEGPQLTLFGANNGWVLVSKDDRFDPILAYSDEPVNIENPSPDFLWLIDCFNKGMERELNDPTLTQARLKVRRKASTTLRTVNPLLATKWDQGWPYNEKSPLINDGHVVCGCVATAYAQVFNYHKLPKKMHGHKTYTWTYEEVGTPLSYDFEKTPFDWDNITISYDKSSSTKAQVNAISDLIFGCGVMAEMNFAPGGSGAYIHTMVRSINDFCEDLRAIDHGGKNMDLEVIAYELNSSRPVVFAGADENGEGGHCFVIDGANDSGYLHCNMGWSGSGNGYYASDAMNGYPSFQQISSVIPCENLNVVEPQEELMQKLISVDTEHPVSELQADTWYAMWNVGRNTGLCDTGKENNVGVSSYMPNNRISSYCAGQIVRLVPNTAGTRYKIQTGLGNYLPSFGYNTSAKPSTSGSATYSITPITDSQGEPHPDCFYLLNADNRQMDCNGINVVGWATGACTDPAGNAAWQFFPVSLADMPQSVLVEDITLNADTMRIMVGESRQLVSSVLPLNATIQATRKVSKSTSYVTIDYGTVTAKAKGSSLITVSSVDGSDVKATCMVYAGTSTQRKTLTSLKSTATYSLCNKGYTNGYLIATSADDAHPTLRGITARQPSITLKDEHYWDEPYLGEPGTQWQFVKDSEGNFYLYNVLTHKFLANSGENTEYVFTAEPTPINVTLLTAQDYTGAEEFVGCFFLNGGKETTSVLMASTGYLNPAHWAGSTSTTKMKLATWEICELSGLSTKLPLLTTTQLEDMLHSEGVQSIIQTATHSARYDMQGREQRSHAPKHGIYIQQGKKVIW